MQQGKLFEKASFPCVPLEEEYNFSLEQINFNP